MKLRSGKTTSGFIGYKQANDKKLVILRIPTTAKHNVNRPNVVNKRYAKHRCSEAYVEDIIDLNTNQSVRSARSQYHSGFEYHVGQTVSEPCFDENLEMVCTTGIHFYLDRKCAMRYGIDGYYMKPFSDGLWRQWHDNGQLCYEGAYKDGQKDGVWKHWYPNGQLGNEEIYKDGEEDGVWKTWHDNGQLCYEGVYKDGQKDGVWKQWYSSGQLFYEENYKDGKEDGVWKYWYENGKLCKETIYKNGRKDGEWKN